MEQKIDATTWDAHLLQIVAENLEDDYYTRAPLENSISQHLEHVLALLQQTVSKEDVEAKGFFSLSENDATHWLFLVHTIQNVSVRETLEKLTIPSPSLYLSNVIKQADRSFFERLLAAEANAEMFYESRPLNKERWQFLITKSFELLQAHESISDRNVTLLHFSNSIPHSVLVPKITKLMDRGANGRGQADNQALAQFVGLEYLWLDLFNYSETPLPHSLFELAHLREVHLDKNMLHTLPPDIGRLQQVFRLSLRENYLTALPDEIGHLKVLDSLDLEKNQLAMLPKTFAQLENLTYLKLNYNAFTEIPAVIIPHKKLLVVDLSNNQITQVPAHIAGNSTSYYLQGNLIEDLPQEFEEGWQTHTIKVLGNPLRNLSPNLVPFVKSQVENAGKYLSKEELTGLFCWMNFHENKQVRKIARDKCEEIIEDEIFQQIKGSWRYRKNPDSEKVLLFCLQYYHPLKLHWPLLQTWLEGLMKKPPASFYSFQTAFYELPEGLFSLSTLQNLDTFSVANAQLKHIPAGITQLPKLTSLYIGNNPMETVPDFLPQLKLKQLSLVNSQLQAIPDAVGQIHTLKHLQLSKNSIKNGFELLTQLAHLEVLYLQRNELTQMPEAFVDIPNLRELHLNHNELGKEHLQEGYALPLKISFMDNLTTLNLSYNCLKRLPPGIGLLEKLDSIFLNNNQFDEFPIELCEVETLKNIYCRHNNIHHLPDDMQYLTQLEYLDLRDNPLSQDEKQKLLRLLPHTRIHF
ncbi:MAG TPA: hypothetical protein DCS93_26655 [Microscillaceae bacterium]|nr:hypothetical protein [Microscillaceae bacterium]